MDAHPGRKTPRVTRVARARGDERHGAREGGEKKVRVLRPENKPNNKRDHSVTNLEEWNA